jgi:CxxC-x17-CxxC domain-containing protein
MGNFKKDKGKRFGGHGGFGGGRGGFGGGKDRGPVTMHQAVCDQCGKPCEVPFRPSGDKPVYCNLCFRNKREGGSAQGGSHFAPKSFAGQPSQGNQGELKNQLELLNIKMDRLIQLVETITQGKASVAKEKVKTVPVVKIKKLAKKIAKK